MDEPTKPEPPPEAGTKSPGPGATLSSSGRLAYDHCRVDSQFTRRYDITTWRELGSGGFAVVAAVQSRLQAEPVAVKVFYRSGAEERKRLVKELKASHKMLASSAAVVHVYSAHEGEGEGDDVLFWLEMELVAGESLGRWMAGLAGVPLPWSEGSREHTTRVLAIALEISQAVAAAAAAGIVHRDIKPENVLLPATPPPLAKLGDFGMSKDRLSSVSDTRSWTGTDLYRAPEVWEQPRAAATPAADIYALGLLLFGLFTNGGFPYQVPPEATNTSFAYMMHKTKAPLRLREVNAAAPQAVEQLLVRAMSKKPAQRPTADEIVQALKAEQVRLAADAPPAREAETRPLAAVVAVAAVLALALGWTLIGKPRPGAGPSVASLPPVSAAASAPTSPSEASVVPTTTATAAPSPMPVSTPPPKGSTPAPTSQEPRTTLPASPAVRPTEKPSSPAAQRVSPSPAASVQPARIVALPPSPRAATAARPQVTIGAVRKGKSLLLAHRGGGAVRDLQLVAVGQGKRCSARVDQLEPGEALMVMWDEFDPEPPADWRPETVELRGVTPSGRLELTVRVE